MAHGPQSAIARLAAASVDDMTLPGAARLVLRNLQDWAVNRLYKRPPPPVSRLLNLGCGNEVYAGWINADRLRAGYWVAKLPGLLRRQYQLPDWMLDAAVPWNCPDDHWDGVYTEHMLEHLSYRDAITTLKEVLRTLRPGGWVRIVVPDLRRFVEYYMGKEPDPEFGRRFRYGAEAMSFLAQRWGHLSVWDTPVLSEVLGDIGFANIAEVSFGKGTDERLIKDTPGRQWESVYIEAQKPRAATGVA